jgi:hypothetical protein
MTKNKWITVIVISILIASITPVTVATSQFSFQKKEVSKSNENITINVYAKQFTFGKFCVYIENYGNVSHDVNWMIEMPYIVPDIWVWNGTIEDLQPGETQLICTDGFAHGLTFFDIRVTVSTEDPNANPIPFPFWGFLFFVIFIILN